MADITVIRGDDSTIGVTFHDSAGADIDITTSTVFFTVKDPNDLTKTNDDCALISEKVTVHTDPTHGKTAIPLTSTDTDLPEATYAWDLQIKTLGGAISSVLRGDFIVVTDVTRRVT